MSPDPLPQRRYEPVPARCSFLLRHDLTGQQVTPLLAIELAADQHPDADAVRAHLQLGREVGDVIAGWQVHLADPGDPGDASTVDLQVEIDVDGQRRGYAVSFDLGRYAVDLAGVASHTTAVTIVDPAQYAAYVGAAEGHALPEDLETVLLPDTVPTDWLTGLLLHAAPQVISPGPWHDRPDIGASLAARWLHSPGLRPAEVAARKLAGFPITHGVSPFALALAAHRQLGADAILEHLPHLTPIVVDRDLIATLPEWEDAHDWISYAHHARLPLDGPLWLDFTAADGSPMTITAEDEQHPVYPLYGCLVYTHEHALRLVPVGVNTNDGPRPDPLTVLDFGATLPHGAPPVGMWMHHSGLAIAPTTHLQDREQMRKTYEVLLGYQGGFLADIALLALQAVEAFRQSLRPTRLSAKQAKLARRRGHAPALTIDVHGDRAATPAAAGSTHPDAPSRTVNATFVRRGSWHAYPTGTQMADAAPADELVWVPKKHAYCRLVWKPPTTVNAGKGPLQRKVRRFRPNRPTPES